MEYLILTFFYALILLLLLIVGFVSVFYRLYEYIKASNDLQKIKEKCLKFENTIEFQMKREVFQSRSLEKLSQKTGKQHSIESTHQIRSLTSVSDESKDNVSQIGAKPKPDSKIVDTNKPKDNGKDDGKSKGKENGKGVTKSKSITKISTDSVSKTTEIKTNITKDNVSQIDAKPKTDSKTVDTTKPNDNGSGKENGKGVTKSKSDSKISTDSVPKTTENKYNSTKDEVKSPTPSSVISVKSSAPEVDPQTSKLNTQPSSTAPPVGTQPKSKSQTALPIVENQKKTQ